MKRVLAACVTIALALTAVTARGEDDRESRARAHYEVGLGMYHLGNYRDAVREFSAGYELSPRPEFLINLGQAYRKLHELESARDMFQEYLARAPADAPDRAQVRGLLAEVEAERAAMPPTPSTPTPANEPTPASTASAPAVGSMPLVVAPAPSPRHGLRRWWWTIPVGAVAVGAVVGVTLYFTLRSSQVSCGSATIACVDLRP